jgi:hypothetical protein
LGEVVGAAHVASLRLQSDGPEDVAQQQRRPLRAPLEHFLHAAESLLDPLHRRRLEHLPPAPTQSLDLLPQRLRPQQDLEHGAGDAHVVVKVGNPHRVAIATYAPFDDRTGTQFPANFHHRLV